MSLVTRVTSYVFLGPVWITMIDTDVSFGYIYIYIYLVNVLLKVLVIDTEIFVDRSLQE